MTSNQPAATRRTVVATAAWAVPIVSTAVAAPAMAASTGTTTLSGVVGTAVKWGNGSDKHVAWDLSLVNGPVAIDEVRITFTYTPTSTGPFTQFEIYGYAAAGVRDTSWTYPAITAPTSVLEATHLTDIPANSTYLIHTDFAGGDNAAGKVFASAAITYVGSTGTVTQTVGPITWGSGSQHVH